MMAHPVAVEKSKYHDSSLPPTDSVNLAIPALKAVGGCFWRFFIPSGVRTARLKYLCIVGPDCCDTAMPGSKANPITATVDKPRRLRRFMMRLPWLVQKRRIVVCV